MSIRRLKACILRDVHPNQETALFTFTTCGSETTAKQVLDHAKARWPYGGHVLKGAKIHQEVFNKEFWIVYDADEARLSNEYGEVAP